MRNFEIKAIVSLPQVTFMHYGAGAKSSVLVMRKRKHGEKASDYAVFSAISEAVGYDATGRASGSDLSSIGNKFSAFKGRKRFQNRDLIFSKNVSKFDRNRLDPYYYSPIFDRIDKRLSRVCILSCPFRKYAWNVAYSAVRRRRRKTIPKTQEMSRLSRCLR